MNALSDETKLKIEKTIKNLKANKMDAYYCDNKEDACNLVKTLIKKGDVILTSGVGMLYPKEIRIGEVIDVEEDQVKVMKNALVKPYVDFNKLEELFIVSPKDTREIKYN